MPAWQAEGGMGMLAGLDPMVLGATALVILFAYTIFGVSGFGSTAIAVPILAHFMPLTFAVPLMVVLDLVAAAFLGHTGREHVSREELKRILPWLFGGIVLGATVLVKVPQPPLKIALGIFVVAVGLNSLANPASRGLISRWWSVPAGIVGGIAAALFGAGGPIYATYLSGRLPDKSALRSTVARLISISALVRTVVYALGGLLLQGALWVAALALTPFVWLGLRAGGRIHTGLTAIQMRRAVGGLLVVSGTVLLARTFLER
jgi:uncharacterized protein